jgi:pilus assembly protein CpaE
VTARVPLLLVLDADEALSLQVERVTGALRPSPLVTWCDSFDQLEHLTIDPESFGVLIAGPMVFKEDGFQRLRALRAQAPEMTLVLATDRWRSGSLRDTVRTGALDILRLPVSDDDLLDAVRQAAEMSRVHSPGARKLEGLPHAKPDDRGVVMAVVSGTGGCGKTFFAVNLAYHLQTHAGKRTCVIDLDLEFGELATALRLKPKFTINDLVSVDPDDDFDSRFLEYLAVHESGIRVLAAPEEPADADAVDVADVLRIIEVARSAFDYVIIDTPPSLSDAVYVVLEQADQLFAMATLDLPSVRNLGILLGRFKRLQMPSDRVRLLLNKVEPDVGIEITTVERYFPQGFCMVIPYGREVNRSLNMGQPVMAYASRSAVSAALASGLSRAVGEEHPDDGAPAALGASRRRGLLPRRSRKPA